MKENNNKKEMGHYISMMMIQLLLDVENGNMGCLFHSCDQGS